jgi:beta-phosphoglucomutase family hydrolase
VAKRVPINTDLSESLCFGCGQNNPLGLKLSFEWDGKKARAEFTPTKFYQGWPGVVHGGIISTLLDEAMAYAARFEGVNCFTSRIQVNFRRPALIDQPLIITAWVTRNAKRLIGTKASVSLLDGTLVAEGTATQFVIETNPGNVSNKERKSAMPRGKLEAVIWDMDGVIADTAPYHFKAWQETFQKRGVNFSEDDFKRHFGQRNDTIIRNTLGGNLSSEEVDAIAEEKEENYRRKVAANIKPLPGAIELIKSLWESGVKLAIASSAPLENIELVMRGLGIDNYFAVIVWGREVSEGKPSPQGFLLAAKRLGVEPRNCVVIEDAVAGVTAARRAGMKCVAVTTTHPRRSLKAADLVVDTLEAISVEDLARLFAPGED